VTRAVLIVNPFASGVTEKGIAAVEAELGRVADVDVLLTRRPGHATTLVEQTCATGGCRAIFVFSGDGGFNEAVNGADGVVPLGFVPGGGTSVLPRALGLPADPVEAAARLAESLVAERVRRISLGHANGRRFTFNAGIGFDAEAVRRMDAHGRSSDGKRPGDLRFAFEFGRMLVESRGRFDPVLEVSGHGRAAFLFVANTDPYTYVRNRPLHVSPGASFEGGLDFVAPIRVRARSLPRLLGYVASSRERGSAADLLTGHDLDRFEVRCDRPLPLQVDGEDLGDVERAVFEAEREALPVLV
jgi:diacylglycerol kinase family enzyme